ncbi:hypothetical protein [Kingella denitrificans]
MKPRRAKSHKTTPDKPSLISSIADYLILLLCIPILAHSGFVEPRHWQVTLALAVIFILPVYMVYRSQLPKSSRTEKIFFTLWKWLRRLLAFACVILFLCFIVLVVTDSATPIGEKLLISAVVAILAFYIAHFGVYGEKYRHESLADVRERYRQMKKRYGWHW